MMKKSYDIVLGSAQVFGDALWHVGLFRDGNCLSWASFSTRAEAEKWVESPTVSIHSETSSFSHN
jgi:hypothetical protein